MLGQRFFEFTIGNETVVRCHILTAVWGPWHTDKFINVNLPSLLAAQNLPDFARKIDTTYVIATSKSDAGIIRHSPAFRSLKKIMRVRVVAYRDSAIGAPIDTHKMMWLDGIRAAAKAGAFYMLNPADVAWADGSFRTVAERLIAGKKALFAMFVRVLDETFTPEALEHNHGDDVISIPPRQMVDMMLRHLHPFNAAYLRDSDQFPFHPEFVMWPIPGEGLLMRPLSTLVVGFYAAEYKIKSNFLIESLQNPQDLAFIDDSDDLFGVSLTTLKKDQDWYTTFRHLDIDEIGAWWNTFYDPSNVPLSRTRFHFHTGGMHSPAWQRARRMSDFLVLQATISREIVRVGRLLRRNGCTIAAEILATAHYAARLRRHWRWPSPVSIVVSNDEALKPYRQDIVGQFLAPGREKELIDFVFDHVFAGTAGAIDHDLRSMSGRIVNVEQDPRGLTLGGCRVITSMELPEDNRLLIVDGVLPSFNLGRADRVSNAAVLGTS